MNVLKYRLSKDILGIVNNYLMMDRKIIRKRYNRVIISFMVYIKVGEIKKVINELKLLYKN
jgi:hypothetical protein